METKDILTLTVTIINSLFVAILSIRSIKNDRIAKRENRKKSWYQSEVFSELKIKNHTDIMEKILLESSSKLEMCEKINDAVLDFFYTSINYVAFFDIKYCENLKWKILSAADEMMYSILDSEEMLTPKETDKILKIYRMKIIYLFYEFDMKTDKSL